MTSLSLRRKCSRGQGCEQRQFIVTQGARSPGPYTALDHTMRAGDILLFRFLSRSAIIPWLFSTPSEQ